MKKNPPRKTAMKRAGKKTREWENVRKEIKGRFLLADITSCEVCGSDFCLSFAHRKPRRYCDKEELYKVALLCQEHHQHCDSKGHDYMFNFVNSIIEKRSVQP